MNTLRAIEAFVAVAENNGFKPAARVLNTSPTAVSRLVQELEGWLGVELLRRTTRKVSLTEVGQQQLLKCQNILSQVSALQLDIGGAGLEPSGTLRITAPVFIAKRFLADLLPKFLDTYKHLNIDLLAADREVDLISEGIDIAIRIGNLADSTLIVRRIRGMTLKLVCSPDYVSRYGEPKTLKALIEHNCLVDTVPKFGERWPLRDTSFKKNYRANGNLRVNNGEIVESIALNGGGIACLPDFFVEKDIAEGRLIHILKDVHSPEYGMYLAYPQTRHVAPKVRAFIDFAIGHTSQLDTIYAP